MFERRAAQDTDSDDSYNRTSSEDEINEDGDDPPSPPPLADPRRGILVSLKDFWDSVRMLVFVLGSAAVLFVAASNTITW